MPVLSTTHPTMADLAKTIGPDGNVMPIAEILHETNEVMTDMVWIEGNLATGHRTLQRTGIPEPTIRMLNKGIPPVKAETVPIEDQCAIFEALNEVDVEVADLYANPAAYRMGEATATIEGFTQTMADNVFYGNESTDIAKFTGFAPRFNTRNAAVPSARNVIHGGGSGSDNASIWLIGWGPNSVHGIYPKGSKAGLQQQDHGKVWSENFGGTGLRAQVYRTHFQWKCGLTVRDWRYVVRIANIDVSDLTKNAATGADLIDLMAQALNKIPSRNMVRLAWYAGETVKGFISRQARYAPNVQLSVKEVVTDAGMIVDMVGGVPLRRVDQLLDTEATVAS